MSLTACILCNNVKFTKRTKKNEMKMNATFYVTLYASIDVLNCCGALCNFLFLFSIQCAHSWLPIKWLDTFGQHQQQQQHEKKSARALVHWRVKVSQKSIGWKGAKKSMKRWKSNQRVLYRMCTSWKIIAFNSARLIQWQYFTIPVDTTMQHSLYATNNWK